MDSILAENSEIKPLFYKRKCDKYDYLMAAGCGSIAGIVDIIFVNTPKGSKLGNWTDMQVDNAVKKFANMCGWNPKIGNENNVASAIGFLEKKFKVNYDQKNSSDVNRIFDMATKNHHMKSLAHAPDIIGLFFSILNQFTSTASFIDNGEIITINTKTHELIGNNFISKLFCGIVNWFGHIMSDIAGSSGSRGSGGRGSGIVIPFFELFGLCNFGKFNIGKDKQTLATLATRAFQEGYDFRYGLTMAIPVILCDISIRVLWSIKQFFFFKKPLSECIPTYRHDDLRVMLLVGNGTLCFIDGLDAFIRSGGNLLNFFLRMNIMAWFRFIHLGIKEICIRFGIAFPLQKQLDAYITINRELDSYLSKLKKIDIEKFKQETELYNLLLADIENISTEKELNAVLVREFKMLGIKTSWDNYDSFDDFMNDKNSVMRFE